LYPLSSIYSYCLSPSRKFILYIIKDFFYMSIHFYFTIYFLKHPFFINNKSRTFITIKLFTKHLFKLPYIICFCHFMINIGKQCKRKPMLVNKLLVFLNRVRTVTLCNCVTVRKSIMLISKVTCLSCTTRGHIFWIKISYDNFPFIIRSSHLYSTLLFQCKVWCLLSCFNTHQAFSFAFILPPF